MCKAGQEKIVQAMDEYGFHYDGVWENGWLKFNCRKSFCLFATWKDCVDFLGFLAA